MKWPWSNPPINSDSSSLAVPCYKMATMAINKLGDDISATVPTLCVITSSDKANFYGHFVVGQGFIGVRFPRITTRDLTPKERAHYRSRRFTVGHNTFPMLVE